METFQTEPSIFTGLGAVVFVIDVQVGLVDADSRLAVDSVRTF